MAEFLSKQMKVGVKIESAWGTSPLAVATTYQSMSCIPGSVKANPNTIMEGVEFTGTDTIHQDDTRKIISNAGVLPTIDFECYATPEVASIIMELAMHTASAANPNEFSPTNGNIDFPSGGGSVGSVIVWSQAGDGYSLKNAVINNVTFSMDNVGGGEARYGRLSGQFVGTSMAADLTITGSLIADDFSLVANNESATGGFDVDLDVGSFSQSGFCWRRYELTIENNVFSDCFDANEASNLKFDSPTIQHKLDIPHNDDTVGFLGSFMNGDLVTITVTNTYVTTVDGYFKFQNGGSAYLQDSPGAEEGIFQANSLSIMDMYNGTSWNPIATISVGV